jgi:hypothetical protein
MPILIVREPAQPEQIGQMLQELGSYIKLAVDVDRGILAGGGMLHADCEQRLLDDGSRQEDIWGADWDPFQGKVAFESLINIRPRQQNYSLEIQDSKLREKVELVVRSLLEVK